MRMLGIRAHDFGKNTVEILAKKVSEKGFFSIQLALLKAIDGIDFSLGKLSPGMAYYIKDTFAKENIQIAVLGCYINPIHPDIDERRKQLDRFKEHIRFARDFGCSVVGTETGSLNFGDSYKNENESEEAFETLIESLKELVKEAEKFGVIVGIEGGKNEVLTCPKKMKRALDIIQSNNLQVIFDPVNYISLENYKDQDNMLKEAFDLFGDRIVMSHAKDFLVKDGFINKATAPGKGSLNYELFLRLLKERKPFVNILLDEVAEADMEESMKFIRNLYDRI
ncbi:MAG: sugar phosphate isomerase/epimerase [Clostridiaceae bacterium]|nr:sugar phosphate isomerase/epimerase [Clostridiaceae bacterium]